MNKGDWMRYSVAATADGSYDVTFRVIPRSADATFHLSANGTAVTGKIAFDGTLSDFAEITVANVKIGADVSYLDLRADNGSFDILSFTITPSK